MTGPDDHELGHDHDEFHDEIRAIHEVVGRFFNMTLEDFEARLLSDDEPEVMSD